MGKVARQLAEAAAEKRRLDSSQAAWKPWSSGPVFSVADVAPLRWLQHVVDAVQPPAAGAAGAQGAGRRRKQQRQAQQGEQQGEGEPGAAGDLEDDPAYQPTAADEEAAAAAEESDELSSDLDMQDHQRTGWVAGAAVWRLLVCSVSPCCASALPCPAPA